MVGFVEPLLRAGFRVAAVDGPAHGRSPGQRADLLRFSEAVHTAIRTWGPASGVIAHSFGAAATLRLLRQSDAPRIPAEVCAAVAQFIQAHQPSPDVR